MILISHRAFKWVVLFVFNIIVSGCTISPYTSIQQAAEELAINDRVIIKRQRQFVIPSTSKIALNFESLYSYKNSSINDDILTIFAKEGLLSFSQFFSSPYILNTTEQTYATDFIININLLSIDIDVSKDSDTQILELKGRRLSPFTTILSVEMVDARTKKTLDVANIDSRSGAFGSKTIKEFIKQTLTVYSRTISSRQIVQK